MKLTLALPFTITRWEGHPDPEPSEPGAMGEGIETVQWARVIVGSGTGELAGLTGTGFVEHELLTLAADLPDA